MTMKEKEWDLAMYGIYIEYKGKRIDPREVKIEHVNSYKSKYKSPIIELINKNT